MAVQLALNDDWDVHFDANGDLVLVDDGEEVAQHVKQRIDFQQGEWFLDESIGLPWFTEILGARALNAVNANRAYAESLIKAEIIMTPGVEGLTSFEFSFDEINRAATFNFRFDTTWGEYGSEFFDTTLR